MLGGVELIKIDKKENCTGCSSCVESCPKSAIYFEVDYEGFKYPKINQDKCIKCSICVQSCPLITKKENLNNNNPIVYAAWNKNEEIRINSTSGGVFTAFAEVILQSGGLVVGAKYSDDFSIEHTVINDISQLSKLRQSKYAQSNLNDIFSQVKNELNKGKVVLFCGTPCQVAGLKSFLNREYKSLFLCDFICRGVISQKVYMEYLKGINELYNSEIKYIQFKNKDYGWNSFSTKVQLYNNDIYQKDRDNDPYMVGFLKHNLYMRPSCYNCQYKSLPRVADISLGDFWGISSQDEKLDDNKGTSVVIVNSIKGENLFENAKEKLFFEKSCIEKVVEGNSCLFNSPNPGKYRQYFFDKLGKVRFDLIIKRIDRKASRKGIKTCVKKTCYLFLIKLKRMLGVNKCE